MQNGLSKRIESEATSSNKADLEKVNSEMIATIFNVICVIILTLEIILEVIAFARANRFERSIVALIIVISTNAFIVFYAIVNIIIWENYALSKNLSQVNENDVYDLIINKYLVEAFLPISIAVIGIKCMNYIFEVQYFNLAVPIWTLSKRPYRHLPYLLLLCLVYYMFNC